MLGSAIGFTAMAACLKLLAQQNYSESQMVFARCAAGLVAMAPFVVRAGAGAWRVARPGPVIVRCLVSTLGFFASFYAFAHLPLADAQAISFSRVLFVVVFAAWFLREKVAWRRWTAVAIGFVGVLMMVRPSGIGLSLASVAAVAAALLFAASIVTIKDLTRDHSTLALVLYANVVTTVAGLPFAFTGWTTPDLHDFGLFLLLGASGVAAQSCYVRALSHGDASLVSLVDYVRLPLAIGAGFLLFNEFPDWLTLLGAVVIIAATAFVTIREAQLGARRPPIDS
jgi:drug/metabolite transporter (DMT)-like permease